MGLSRSLGPGTQKVWMCPGLLLEETVVGHGVGNFLAVTSDLGRLRGYFEGEHCNQRWHCKLVLRQPLKWEEAGRALK